MTFQNKRLVGIILAVAILLSIPLIAMQFTKDVDWKLLDFTIMGVLLLGTGIMCEIVLRTVKSWAYRLLICAAILLGFFLVWAELAVGLFGTRFAGS